MKEKIILAPGARASELLRTLARFGVNTLGLRIVNGIELSKIALMKSGVSVTEKFLPAGDEAAVIYSFLNGIPYFDSASYADAENLAVTLRTLRGLAKADERSYIKAKLANGEFPDKNDAIVLVYEKFIETVKKDGLIDGIGLIRRALSEAAPFDAEFMSVSEFPLTMLEEELLSHVSGGKHQNVSLTYLFGDGKGDEKELSYMEGYGAVNEAEDIMACILSKNIPLDKAVIACANTSSYLQLLFDLSGRYDIPMSFGSGVPITNSHPADLLKKICEWDVIGYHGIDALKAMISSESFDRGKLGKALDLEGPLQGEDLDGFSVMAGNLRLSFDKADNDRKLQALKSVLLEEQKNAKNKKAADSVERRLVIFDMVEKFAEELSKGICGMLEYSVIRPEPAGRIDQSAKMVLIQTLQTFLTYAPDGDLSGIVSELLLKTVSSEAGKEGQLHICSLKDALSSVRENVFVCGLSASDYPGSPSENYLLLDNDLKRFGDDPRIPTSVNRVNRRKKELDDLLSLCGHLGVKVQLSYSGYSLSELKDQNPSSVLFTYYEKDHPSSSMDDFKKAVRKAGYFESALSSSRLVAKEYSKGNDIDCDPSALPEFDAKKALDKPWSPSALEIFFQCPLRFCLTKILWLPEDEPDDPFVVIDARNIGKLAHSLMEEHANKVITRDEFLKDSEAAFMRYLAERPPLHPNDAALEKTRFLKMMGIAYEQEIKTGNEVLSAEEKYTFTHPTGITLSGYPDRVEKDKNGNFIIADFKTKQRLEHVKDDIDTCLQVVIYAWLCEQAGIKISRCDYRYIRKNEVITCRYDDDMKAKLTEKLQVFKDALETGNFPKAEDKDACRYCRMEDICKQFGEDAEDEDEE